LSVPTSTADKPSENLSADWTFLGAVFEDFFAADSGASSANVGDRSASWNRPFVSTYISDGVTSTSRSLLGPNRSPPIVSVPTQLTNAAHDLISLCTLIPVTAAILLVNEMLCGSRVRLVELVPPSASLPVLVCTLYDVLSPSSAVIF
jgi:hypothetical protein